MVQLAGHHDQALAPVALLQTQQGLDRGAVVGIAGEPPDRLGRNRDDTAGAQHAHRLAQRQFAHGDYFFLAAGFFFAAAFFAGAFLAAALGLVSPSAFAALALPPFFTGFFAASASAR